MTKIKTKQDAEKLLNIDFSYFRAKNGYNPDVYSIEKKDNNTYIVIKYVSCNSWKYTYQKTKKEMINFLYSMRSHVNNFLNYYYFCDDYYFDNPNEYNFRKKLLAL